jgi:hypothetical protein
MLYNLCKPYIVIYGVPIVVVLVDQELNNRGLLRKYIRGDYREANEHFIDGHNCDTETVEKIIMDGTLERPNYFDLGFRWSAEEILQRYQEIDERGILERQRLEKRPSGIAVLDKLYLRPGFPSPVERLLLWMRDIRVAFK